MLSARTVFCTLFRRVEDEHRSLVIDKRGTRQGIRNYVRLAGPGAEVLRFIAEESKREGTDTQTSRDMPIVM